MPKFKLPDGYRMGWKTKCSNGEMSGGYVLRSPQNEELGYFEFVAGEERAEVEAVLKAHLKPRVAWGVRVHIFLEDSSGNVVGSLDIEKPPKNQIEAMIEDLANR